MTSSLWSRLHDIATCKSNWYFNIIYLSIISIYCTPTAPAFPNLPHLKKCTNHPTEHLSWKPESSLIPFFPHFPHHIIKKYILPCLSIKCFFLYVSLSTLPPSSSYCLLFPGILP
jgi:hypothetical protein